MGKCKMTIDMHIFGEILDSFLQQTVVLQINTERNGTTYQLSFW